MTVRCWLVSRWIAGIVNSGCFGQFDFEDEPC